MSTGRASRTEWCRAPVRPGRVVRPAHKTHREDRARRDIDEVFNDYLEWVQETMTAERTPWLKVICVMVGGGTTVVTDSASTTRSRAGSGEDSRA